MLTGAVIGVMIQVEPVQVTISLDVAELSVVMKVDPSNCSQ